MEVGWCPSHGKCTKWTPSISEQGSTEDRRRWNDSADERAKEGATKQVRYIGYRRYAEARLAAAGEARGLMRMLQEAAVDFIDADPALAEHFTSALVKRKVY